MQSNSSTVAPRGSGTLNNGYRRIHVAGRLVYEHRHIWEMTHGPIPPGHVLHHLDGDKTHNVLANLVLLTRAEHARLHQTIARTLPLGNPPIGTWARHYDACQECGGVERRHAGHGSCIRCYNRHQKVVLPPGLK